MTPFIDANVVTKAFTDNTAKGKCAEMLHKDFVTNTLCLVESQRAIAKISKDGIYASLCIKSLFKRGGLIVPLDKNLLLSSLKLAARTNLNAFDSVHYATALLKACSEFISYDKEFDNLSIKRTEP
jgi:predicted nucleic acid-binding protein